MSALKIRLRHTGVARNQMGREIRWSLQYTFPFISRFVVAKKLECIMGDDDYGVKLIKEGSRQILVSGRRASLVVFTLGLTYGRAPHGGGMCISVQ
jgi:hypothetical protein